MSKSSNELPATISLNTLRWILGDVTTEYCNQLKRQGLLEKASRGTYTTASVRAMLRRCVSGLSVRRLGTRLELN
jgi:hypothetical protein